MSPAVPIQRGWYQLDAVPFECGVNSLVKSSPTLKDKDKDKDRDKDKDNETEEN